MQVTVEQFQSKYFQFMNDVTRYNCEIIITKLGTPIAKLIPIVKKDVNKKLFGYMKDSVLIHDDIITPIEEKWEVDDE